MEKQCYTSCGQNFWPAGLFLIILTFSFTTSIFSFLYVVSILFTTLPLSTLPQARYLHEECLYIKVLLKMFSFLSCLFPSVWLRPSFKQLRWCGTRQRCQFPGTEPKTNHQRKDQTPLLPEANRREAEKASFYCNARWFSLENLEGRLLFTCRIFSC